MTQDLENLVGEWSRNWRQCGCDDLGCRGRHDERDAILDDVEATLLPILRAALTRRARNGEDVIGS